MTRFDPSQITILKDIGIYLRQVREEQAKSLEEIAAKTYIPMRMLKAIEAGQETILPEPVFVRGFIRRYAEALGLDGLDLAKEFPLQIATPSPEVEPAPELPPIPVAPKELKPIRSPNSRPRSLYPMYLGIGAIALIGIIYALIKSGLPATLLSSIQSGLQRDADDDETATASPSATAPTPTADISPIIVQPSPIAPVQVDVSLTGSSWMRVTVDGKVQYEGTLASGTKQTWAGQDAVVIRAGNAGAVTVSFNQGAPQIMGDPGAIASQTFTADTGSTQPPSQ